MSRNVLLLVTLASIAAAGGLAGCDRDAADKAQRKGAEVGQKIDKAIDRTQQKLAQAGEKTQETLSQAGERISEATDKVAANVKDAVKSDGDRPSASGSSANGAATSGSGSATDSSPSPAGRGITTTLKTGPETSMSGLPAGTREALGDTAITTAVKAGFLKDPGLSVLKIDVDTRGGVVTLNGLAQDEAARERAARIAGETRGVKDVRNHLTVKRG